MLDFTQTPKRFLTIRLIDDNCIMVRMPTKRVFDCLKGLEERLDNLQMQDSSAIDEIYDLTSEVLSNNKAGVQITSDYLSRILDIEDIGILFKDYVRFVRGETDSPNSESPHAEALNPTGITPAAPNGNG